MGYVFFINIPARHDFIPKIDYFKDLLIALTNTNTMREKILLSFALLIAMASSGIAQDHVTVYRDCQYRGNSHNLYEGKYLDRDLGVGNDAISAIRIPKGWKVIVYTNNNFQGASRTFEESVSCMPADLNDKISSMRVERVRGYNQSSRTSYGSGSGMITLYVDCNFRGGSHQLRPGTYNADQLGIGNDRLSAIRIPNGMKVTVYMDNNMRGASLTFDKDVECMPAMYNDKVSSIRVESTHGKSGYNQAHSTKHSQGSLSGSYNARGKVPCKINRGMPTSNCDFGVVRRGNGDADVHIKMPNGKLRIIYFQNGRAVGYDRSQGGGNFRTSKESDLYIVNIGDERYEIPEAVIYGG